jgi:hypothetical protein
MIPDETNQGIGEREIKENDGGSDPRSTTIIKKKLQ